MSDTTELDFDFEPKPIIRKYGLIPSKPGNYQLLENRLTIQRDGDLPPAWTKLVAFTPSACNQLSVGMCTGCGTSRAIKCLCASKGYKWPYMPSALDIYAKTRQAEGTDLTDDSGCSIADVMNVINTQGVCPEDSNPEWSWPFSASDNRWQEMPPPACAKDALIHKVNFYKVNPDVNSIKSAIYKGFPVVIGIPVHQSFESSAVAASGVIPMPGMFFDDILGGHCLYLDAYGMYDANHADGPNSWGQDWGDWLDPNNHARGRGRFHIPFDYLCNLASDLFALELAT